MRCAQTFGNCGEGQFDMMWGVGGGGEWGAVMERFEDKAIDGGAV